MMNFTTQQLMGGQRYTAGVKIGAYRPRTVLRRPSRESRPRRPLTRHLSRAGNWDEDIARVEIASRDFEARRSKGELLHLRKAREAAFLSQSAPHSVSRDGLLRYGDAVQVATGGAGDDARVLSNHVFTFLAPGHARVTAGARRAPMARNVWTLRAVAPRARGWARAPGVPLDDVVRFGDRLRLEADAALVADAETGA
jgi:hypothetical protein